MMCETTKHTTMYTITSYKPHFHDAILAIADSIFEEECRNYFRSTLRDASLQSIVALKGRTVVGFALLSVGRYKRTLPHGLKISFLCIHPNYQRQGIGSALLQSVKDLNYEHVWLEVTTDNTQARALYERQGFRVWAAIGYGQWTGYVMGYSTQRREWLPRLRSRVHPLRDETAAPCSARPQTDSTLAYRSRLRSARNLPPTAS